MAHYGGGLVLENFAGDWSDSLGNDVRVWDSGQGFMQVMLRRPDGTGKEMMMQIRRVGVAFLCGHYECDQHQSSSSVLAWRDQRHADRITVWKRKAHAGGSQIAPQWNAPHAQVPAMAGSFQPDGQNPALVMQPFHGQMQTAPQMPHMGMIAPTWPSAPMMPQSAYGAAGVHTLRPAHVAPLGHSQPRMGALTPPGVVPQFAGWSAAAAPIQTIGIRPGEHQPPQPALTQAPMHITPRFVPPPASTGPAPAWAGRPVAPGPTPPPPSAFGMPYGGTVAQPANAASAPSATDDWAHVLNVLAAARDEGSSGSGAKPPDAKPADGQPAPKSPGAVSQADTEPDEGNAQEHWGEVLELLERNSGDSAQNSQVNQMFNVFGGQQKPQEDRSEELRAQVLQETLAKLLQQKSGVPAARDGDAQHAVPAAQTVAESDQPCDEQAAWEGGADVPDWQRKTGARLAPRAAPAPRVVAPPAPVKVIGAEEEKGPLDKFIRIFGLDELASKCLRALEDDEAAFVIESCQGRLRHARNPSAVVMTSIKAVAARVGRRYYGSRYNSELAKLLEQHSAGENAKASEELKFFEGEPEPEVEAAASDPYGAVVDLEELEQVAAKSAKRTANGKMPEAKKSKTSDTGTVEVLAASPEAESDEDDDDGAGLFVVDTGG